MQIECTQVSETTSDSTMNFRSMHFFTRLLWKERGSEVALANMNDASALTAAFTRVNGVFVLIPSIFDPTPGFPEAKAAIIAAVTTAVEAAKPPKVVCLSGIGAQATQPNLLQSRRWRACSRDGLLHCRRAGACQSEGDNIAAPVWRSNRRTLYVVSTAGKFGVIQ
jgi:hypothetical protein